MPRSSAQLAVLEIPRAPRPGIASRPTAKIGSAILLIPNRGISLNRNKNHASHFSIGTSRLSLLTPPSLLCFLYLRQLAGIPSEVS
jgi:hypothetical protein